MDIYFSGAEQPLYLQLLRSLNVTHIAISFYEWQRRHASDELLKHIPYEMKVCITAGVARKSLDDWRSFSESYIEFAARNAEHALIYDMDAPGCPDKIRRWARDELTALSNSVAFPVEADELESLAARHERIGINARVAKSVPSNELRRLPATLYGSNVTDPRTLRLGHFSASTTATWLSGKRYGELWVYTRGKLAHYTAEELAKGCRSHVRDIVALGVDPEACLRNDHDALTLLAVRSLQVMAEGLSERRRDRRSAEIAATTAVTPSGDGPSNAVAVPVISMSLSGALEAAERERQLLPGLSLDTGAEVVKVGSAAASLRVCDTCYLAAACPKFEAGASCAFKIPVEFKSQAQWEAACQALLEMQFQRVAFGVFAEQVEGGGLAPRTGQEMDRYMRLLSQLKELNRPIDAPQAGALSRIFAALQITGGNDDQGQEAGLPGEALQEESGGQVQDEPGEPADARAAN